MLPQQCVLSKYLQLRTEYTASHPERRQSSLPTPWEINMALRVIGSGRMQSHGRVACITQIDMRRRIWFGMLQDRDNLDNVGVDMQMLLKFMLNVYLEGCGTCKLVVGVVVVLLLLTRHCKRQAIYWIASEA